MAKSSLTEQFNNLSTPLMQVTERLQEVLDCLPQKLAALPEGKDIIKFMVPVEDDGFLDRNIQDIKFAFVKELAARYPSHDCMVTGKISDCGDFLGINIMVGQKSLLATAQEQEKKYETLTEHLNDLDKILAPEELEKYVAIYDEMSALEFTYIQQLARGIDPNTLPQKGWVRPNGEPVKSEGTQARTWYVDMPAWPKFVSQPDRNLMKYLPSRTPKN
jgi:hypothetical protein